MGQLSANGESSSAMFEYLRVSLKDLTMDTLRIRREQSVTIMSAGPLEIVCLAVDSQFSIILW